jgi:two-component system CheB/CheR fusion protein
MGASAGGLEALKSFFSHLPEKCGLTFIVLVHTTPDHATLLPSLLQKTTRVPVSTTKDQEALQPGRIYIVPPGKDINIHEGTAYLLAPAAHGPRLPIDFFFRTLALDQSDNAAGVILSGTGTDGTQGVREIKLHEGFVLAQTPESAKYDGMPKSAIGTGAVDLILTPQEMPERIGQYFEKRLKARESVVPAQTEEHTDWLTKIFSLIRARIGHDFSAYKKNTMYRRVQRRMDVNRIEDHQVYIRFLRENPDEMDALFRELLIGVTSFFREPESFERLKNDILPELLAQREDDTFRAWIPGCSSGEEAYSLAIILRECLDRLSKRMSLQLFATDIDKEAIDRAREGLFPATISADVSEKRLRRFFTKEGSFYRVNKEIRECIVFSVQDVLQDPPFSRLDLLSCRNLLIYLEPEAQKRLLTLFHYTLRSGGILVLSSSETVGGLTNLFQTVDGKWKVYKRLDVPQALQQQLKFPTGGMTVEQEAKPSEQAKPARKADIGRSIQKIVLERFSPASVLVDPQGNILHFQGDTSKYLKQATGPPSQRVLDMAREGLRIELSKALRNAASSGEEEIRRGIRVKTDKERQTVNLRVLPLKIPRDVAGNYLVVFEEAEEVVRAGAPSSPPSGEASDEQEVRIAELEQELQNTWETHQATVEELESSNEELKSTNEELQSSNEELQSTNEELESSKEELQSLNEELQTVNSELQSKVEELSAAYDDMNNLLQSTQIATIFVDNDLKIKRFTDKATALINLIESDIGRPIHHVSTNLQEDIIPDLKAVLDKLNSVEKELVTTQGEWYIMRIMPYRTMDNRIDGAVLTFSNIDEQKKTQERLQRLNQEMEQAWLLVRSVFDMNQEPLGVLDREGRLVIANTAFYNLMNVSQSEVEGKDVFSLEQGILEHTDLKNRLLEALEKGHDFQSTPFRLDGPQGGQSYSIGGTIIRHSREVPYRILLHIQQESPA